jgi:hypothetical protein
VRIEVGQTAECVSCGTAVLLVNGPPVQLWCHGARMRPAASVACSEPIRGQFAGGLAAGDLYRDPVGSSTLRCTRAGGGWPTLRPGEATLIRAQAKQATEFTDALASAGPIHLGQTHPSRLTAWLSPRTAETSP